MRNPVFSICFVQFLFALSVDNFLFLQNGKNCICRHIVLGMLLILVLLSLSFILKCMFVSKSLSVFTPNLFVISSES